MISWRLPKEHLNNDRLLRQFESGNLQGPVLWFSGGYWTSPFALYELELIDIMELPWFVEIGSPVAGESCRVKCRVLIRWRR